MRYRIIFKICTITYQAISTKQPAYLHSMLTPARQPRQLRSYGSGLLSVPRVNTNAGTRAFSVAAPTLWNSLPDSVKSARNIASFRRNLKTYIFKMAYPPWLLGTSIHRLTTFLHCTWSRECLILCFCCATELGFSEDIGAKEVFLLLLLL